MNEWEAVLLGALQGATEFLPVSSSGHLVMGQTLMGISVPGVFFEVALHLATLISVLVVYRGRLGTLAVGAVGRDAVAWRYLGLLVLATVPAAVVGLGFGDAVEALFDAPAVVGVALLVTGVFLWSARAAQRRTAAEGADAPGAAGGPGAADGSEAGGGPRAAGGPGADRGPGAAGGPGPDGGRSDPGRADAVVGSRPLGPGVAAALAMGVAQSFALVPGISRSGATVVVGLWMGVEAREAAAFSFLMAIPAIGGAAVLKSPEMVAGGPGVGMAALSWGFGVAAVTGVLAIRLFVAMLRNRSFHRFGLYCWAAGAAFLLYLALR